MSGVSAVLLKVSRSRAPRLTGLALRLFVSFVESPFSAPLYAKLLRDSGIPQVLSLHFKLVAACTPAAKLSVS